MVMIVETDLVEYVAFQGLCVGKLFTFMKDFDVKLKVSSTAYYCLTYNVLYTDKSIEGLLTRTVSEYQGRLELRNE